MKKTTLTIAAQDADLRRIHELIRHGGDINSLNHLGLTPLSCAAAYGHAETVEFLLANGADPNILDRDGLAPLHKAADGNDLLSCETLLKYGANVNQPTPSKTTPLMIAASGGYLDLLKLLIEVGQAKVNLTDIGGRTALMRAADRGRSEIVATLLKLGADLYSRDCDGRNATYFAETQNYTNILTIFKHFMQINPQPSF